MRVVANSPELYGQNAHQAEIDPATWRNVRLRMEKLDGGELLVTLLRTAEWLKTQNAEPGNTIRLTFVELGIDGPADVLAVEACPTIESGNGRVVTGTFRHSAANVIDLYVTSDDQPIGTTVNHPFWSETRQDFVQAGTLQPGEKLRTATGASAHVRHLISRSRSAEVFNLEVDAEHYLQLVDWSSRLIRPGKRNLSTAIPDILTRLEIDDDCWKETLQQMLGPNKKIDSYFGGTNRLSEVATQRGCKYIKNISGRDVPLNTPSAG